MSFSSSSGTSVPGLSIKKFESQDEVDEKKRKRQEEWDKVRKPEDPLECPEEPSDNRCLYDRLEEQRLKKQEEFEEQVAFRNQVKRLDEDEVEFLDFVSERQQDLTREKKKEEADIISEMKDAQVVKLTESKTEEKKSNKPVQQTTTTKKSQSALLAGAVKRKGSEEASTSKKSKLATSEVQSSQDLQTAGNSSNDTVKLTSTNDEVSTERSAGDSTGTSQSNGVAKVVAVLPSVLPGMNQYDDSSDSMSSSSDSEPDFNIGGRNFTFVNKIQQSR